MVAMLSDSRSIVAISRMVGKDEKSSGRWIHSATIRISTESAIEKARPMSIRKAGIGRNSTARMMTMPMREEDVAAVLGHRAGLNAFADRHVFPKSQACRACGSLVTLSGQACAKVGDWLLRRAPSL